MMDNATNNDTLIATFEAKCAAAGIDSFSAKRSRLRCMPHTIHLAVMEVRHGFWCKCILFGVFQLLKAVGGVEDENKSGKTRVTPYQESVVPAPQDDNANESAIAFDEEDTEGDAPPEPRIEKGKVVASLKAALWKVRVVFSDYYVPTHSATNNSCAKSSVLCAPAPKGARSGTRF
jgi:hypothetical protein